MKHFDDIRYVERIDKYGKTLGVVMPGGFWVFKTTMISAWNSVHANWNKIDWTEKQSAESLIGNDVWHLEVDGSRKALGRCIAFFVKHNMLPEPVVLARKRNGKLYKGGKRFYALAGSVNVTAKPAVAAKVPRLPGAVDPRNIRIDAALLSKMKPITATTPNNKKENPVCLS